jgi:hypothetical protein
VTGKVYDEEWCCQLREEAVPVLKVMKGQCSAKEAPVHAEWFGGVEAVEAVGVGAA